MSTPKIQLQGKFLGSGYYDHIITTEEELMVVNDEGLGGRIFLKSVKFTKAASYDLSCATLVEFDELIFAVTDSDVSVGLLGDEHTTKLRGGRITGQVNGSLVVSFTGFGEVTGIRFDLEALETAPLAVRYDRCTNIHDCDIMQCYDCTHIHNCMLCTCNNDLNELIQAIDSCHHISNITTYGENFTSVIVFTGCKHLSNISSLAGLGEDCLFVDGVSCPSFLEGDHIGGVQILYNDGVFETRSVGKVYEHCFYSSFDTYYKKVGTGSNTHFEPVEGVDLEFEGSVYSSTGTSLKRNYDAFRYIPCICSDIGTGSATTIVFHGFEIWSNDNIAYVRYKVFAEGTTTQTIYLKAEDFDEEIIEVDGYILPSAQRLDSRLYEHRLELYCSTVYQASGQGDVEINYGLTIYTANDSPINEWSKIYSHLSSSPVVRAYITGELEQGVPCDSGFSGFIGDVTEDGFDLLVPYGLDAEAIIPIDATAVEITDIVTPVIY